MSCTCYCLIDRPAKPLRTTSTRVVSSRILRTELTRVLRREGLPVSRRDEILDVLARVPVTEGVLAAGESLERHVKTLDAIHVGSVIAAGLDATIVSHDTFMLSVATSLATERWTRLSSYITFSSWSEGGFGPEIIRADHREHAGQHSDPCNLWVDRHRECFHW